MAPSENIQVAAVSSSQDKVLIIRAPVHSPTRRAQYGEAEDPDALAKLLREEQEDPDFESRGKKVENRIVRRRGQLEAQRIEDEKSK